MKPLLFLMFFTLSLCMGCERVNRAGYQEFRRSTDRFQVAEKPVYRFKVDKTANRNKEIPISALTDFELPESGLSAKDQISLSPPPAAPIQSFESPKRAESYSIPRTRNSRPPDPGSITAVPQTQLPKPVADVNLNKKDVQYLLKQLGYYSGKIDGVYGPQTKAAIKKFQKSEGLTVDGVVGRKTKAALVKKLQKKFKK